MATSTVDTDVLAQGEDDTPDNESERLKGWLAQHNVPDSVFEALLEDEITLKELATFSNQDLTDWSQEHGLKTIVRRRFINAIELLPNARVAENTEIVQIYIDKEEKEQISKFDEMGNSLKTMVDEVNSIKQGLETDVAEAKDDVNNACNDILKYVETMRTNLLKTIDEMESQKNENYDANTEYLNQLLTTILDTKKDYDVFLKNKSTAKPEAKKKMKQAIEKCETKYNEYVRVNTTPAVVTGGGRSNSASITGREKRDKGRDKDKESKKDDKVEKLKVDTTKIVIKRDSTKEIKSKISKLVKLVKNDNSDSKDNSENGIFKLVREITVTGANKYEFCTFDKKFTNINSEGELKSQDKHLIIGSNNHCYATLSMETGLNSGTHCWRMYYFRKKNSSAFNWLFYGLYPWDVAIESTKTFEHDNVWGIGGNTCQTFVKGKRVDDQDMQFLYLSKVNMVDMLVDFDKQFIKYKIVSDVGLDDGSGGGSNGNTSTDTLSTGSGKKNTLGSKRKSKHYKGSKSMNIKDMANTSSKGSKSSKDSKKSLGNPDAFREYELKMDDFNKDIKYTIHFNFYWKGTEIQVAKINAAMFGRDTKLVQWANRYLN